MQSSNWLKQRYKLALISLPLLLLLALSSGAARADILVDPSPSCDPSKQSCVPGSGGGGGGGGGTPCTPARQALGLCTLPTLPPGGGGGGGGGTCSPPGNGNPSCGGAGPASQGGGGGGGVHVGGGNPIHLISGNKYQEETDLAALPGVLGLELKRYYNSLSSNPGLLGVQWRMSYETVLHDLGQQIQIVQADGRRLSFAKQPGRSLCVSPQPGDGQVRIEAGTAGQLRYHWRWPDGRTLSFGGGSQGGQPLQSIRAASGEQVQLSYSPLGDLLSVRDPQGRQLSFVYGRAGAGQRPPLLAIQTPLGRIHYSQDKQGRLSEVAYAFGGETRPGQTATGARLYHYEAEHQAGNPWALTGISLRQPDPQTAQVQTQRLASYAYEASGRAILSSKGQAQQRDAAGQVVAGTGVEQISLHYLSRPLPTEGRPDRSGEVQARSVGKTVLTNSLGQKTELLSAVIGGQYRLLQSLGPGCASCGPTNMSYGYDSAGRLIRASQLDAQGRPLQAELRRYDAQGRLVETARQSYQAGKPQSAQWLQRYAYSDIRYADGSMALGQQPARITQPSVIAGQTRSTELAYNALGQLTRVTERGWSPVDAEGKEAPAALERTTTYRYTTLAGNSLLAEIDGPLANGPKGLPEDSDITRLTWDEKGVAMLALQRPGAAPMRMAYQPGSGRLEQVEDGEGIWTRWSYDDQGRMAQLSSSGPAWARPVVRSISYDELGRPVEMGEGERASGNYRPLLRQAMDVAGRPLWRADAKGVLESYRFDTEGQLLEQGQRSARMALTQQYAYAQGYGQLSSFKDSRGGGFAIDYGPDGQPQRITDLLGRSLLPLPDVQAAADRPLPAHERHDDFGRSVLSLSPDSGRQLRQFDAADRMVAAVDAQGHRAEYAYDPGGRIVTQRVRDSSRSQTQTTMWTYVGSRLVSLEHPEQSERYEYDLRGLRVSKTVTLKLSQGEPYTSLTRYRFDEAGVLQASSLPDGSWLLYERNGQGQVVALKRSRFDAAWLQKLGPAQTLVSELERDLVGLRHAKSGNGISTHALRSREGVLARLIHRHPQAPNDGAGLAMLGLASAHAAGGAKVNEPWFDPSAPGAWGHARDPQALVDRRYLWDAQGNLLLGANLGSAGEAGRTAAQIETQAYAYDGRDRLVAAVRARGAWAQGPNALTEQHSSRWYFDAAGRRRLQQEEVADAADLSTQTLAPAYQAGSHRWLGTQAAAPAQYNANGQATRMGQRSLRWDALGRLLEVREADGVLGAYRYNHRGERVAKATPTGQTHFLYQDRLLSAELDAQGRITRQYVYLADLPIALIDSPQGLPAGAGRSAFSHMLHDAAELLSAWRADSERLVWLHANHLGAVEAATDERAKLIWQADYAEFGKARVSPRVQAGFVLNLRLPGQHWDAETGWHYNDHRYYDPARGEYLTPDPLGTPDGPNAYSYVRANPLRFVDPSGLILFAFDGTGNTEESRTNVYWLRKAYQDNDMSKGTNDAFLARADKPFYIEGPGTGALMDGALAHTLRDRINTQLDRLDTYVKAKWQDEFVDKKQPYSKEAPLSITLDIVGFSRGAAAARDFSNQIIARKKADYFNKKLFGYEAEDSRYNCVDIQLRFMGLFDSVLSTAIGDFNLTVDAAQFQTVAHAVAVNEHRAMFPLESAMGGTAGQVIERGFIGAHSDVGGGYAGAGGDGGDLSDVALNWMWQQAKAAGLKMDDLAAEQRTVSNPILHDETRVLPWALPGMGGLSRDREVRVAGRESPGKSTDPEGGMRYALSQSGGYIRYNPATQVFDPGTGDTREQPCCGNRAGLVDMQKYGEWLRSNLGVVMQ
ncbi:RHS repeat-associated protein [Paucibacter oligotrophus]|uniref:RHS repeat-associated protein n=1 Tax=Roseateles oligotrophus TaxID=1769250 RepID=A0A840L3V5_9BURK|nr:RHS repeat-associated core domain-containing protein [Roseateles oligotrophus]MBB4842636.1 RHS repeat-associated protein [Roseateles oligotrophus]